MLVKIEQRHIDAGHRDSALLCPIGIVSGLFIGNAAAWLYGCPSHRLGWVARDFVRRFDAGLSVSPCTVALIPIGGER